jgi:2-amino-4-hydroxy-6-hydroxymethyldihydropteridine diphosphokinase
MQLAYLSLGANLGDRLETLRGALERIAHLPDSQFIAASSFYETSPVGFETEHWFINCAACILTHLPPPVLLDHCRVIEAEMGRERADESWGVHDRVLDIDIIAYGSVVLATPMLTLPHPRAAQRLFVLLPLAELNAEMMLEGKAVTEWADAAKRKNPGQVIRKVT